MSLDVCIKFKERKMVNYNKTHVACGSTLEVHGDKEEFYQSTWCGNITHNIGEMAEHIPVRYMDERRGISYKGTLYEAVWRGDEIGKEMLNTDTMTDILTHGINYMIANRKDLIRYNPENGWGDYDSFLSWLIKYKEMCEDNPDCEIEISR